MNLLYIFERKSVGLFIEWNWSALIVDCIKNEQLSLEHYAVWSEKMLSYLFIYLLVLLRLHFQS